ncbi:hypothetical protein RN001_003161 [Aquatica leii]|uniref:Reticulon-like protein n=1 Tax=Aquatica leii TaxID=1421715 RepID=A0AAN7SSZ2_9COLE|nr:hypothetical protein RN001_003161 [Aquatica leii]
MDKLEGDISEKSHSLGDLPPIRREKDSLDDFEHLGLDSPLQEGLKEGAIGVSSAARDELEKIDTVSEPAEKLLDSNREVEQSKMDSNLLDISDSQFKAEDKMDRFLSELTSCAPPVPSHDVSPFDHEKKLIMDGVKATTQNFMDLERGDVFAPKLSSINDDIERVTYPEVKRVGDAFNSAKEIEFDPFKSDFTEVKEPAIPIISSKLVEAPKVEPLPSEPIFDDVPAPKPPTPKPLVEAPKESPPPPAKKIDKTPEVKLVEVKAPPAEAIFKKMGLDAWFNPERLNPKVESLIYWRDPKKSGPVFVGVLVVLLALTYLSLITVVAYVSLLALTATISFRIYKNIVHAVQKTGDGHPFKEFLEIDISLPQEKVKEVVEVAVAHVNAAAVELRRLFLVEDLVDSIKFGVLLWCFTYLGAWFNGMTLVIIAWVALFTLPKLYETNKTQIDANLDLVRSKVAEITSKVKAAIPIGKKAEEKKEQ